MKNLIKVALIVAGLSLSGSVVKAQLKLAVINSSELLQSMPDMKAADVTLADFQKKLQTQLEGMAAEREKKIAAFEAKKLTLSEANKDLVNKELQTMVTEIQDLEQRISAADQKAQQDYKTKSEEIFNPILAKATTAVNAIAKEKGYAAVWDTSQPGIIYFEGLDNIMALVKTKLGIPLTAPAAAGK